jgi:hypothetical protein
MRSIVSKFIIELNTCSDYPAADIQQLLAELAELIKAKFGNMRDNELQHPVALFIEGLAGTLSFSSHPPESGDVSEIERFLEELNRRLNDNDVPGTP